jgi:hypothetical protein
MSAVLTMQIMHALFPSLRDTSSPSLSPSGTDPAIPKFHVQPAEDMELRPLLHALDRRHRRSWSAESAETMRSAKE